jgi:hypothetical protein
VADPDDGIRRLDDLDLLAREHGVVPAFRWPEEGDEVEACFVRLHRGEGGEGELAVLEVGAADGSWSEDYLVCAEQLEDATSQPGRPRHEPDVRDRD